MFSLREHQLWAQPPDYTWTKITPTIIRMNSTIVSMGEGFVFIVVPRVWLNGKYIRWRWQGTSGIAMSFWAQIYDGPYDRTSKADFPPFAAIPLKGAGLLQTLRTRNAPFGPITEDVLVNVSAGTEAYCTIMFWFRDAWIAQTGWMDLDWFEINSGAGGAGPLYDEQFTDIVHMEVSGTNRDYGYISYGVITLAGWTTPLPRVEIFRRPLRFHDDSFSSGWTVTAGSLTWDRDFDIAGLTNGTTIEKDISATFAAQNKYVYVYCPAVGSRVRIYLRDTLGAWHLIITITENIPGFQATQIATAFTTDRIRIVVGPEGAGNSTIDYIVICDYMRIVPNCPRVEVNRKDEKDSISTAEFIAERRTLARTGTYWDSEYDDTTTLLTYTGTYLGRSHVKIWMSGYTATTLVKQFTGLVTKIDFLHGKVHRQLDFSCMSYMVYTADSYRSISFEDEPTPASSAIKSIVQELKSQSVIRTDRVSNITSHITNAYDHENIYEALQDIVNDPRINCHMYAGVDGDLFVFPMGSRQVGSIISREIRRPTKRSDDYSPGILVNSAIVLGDWSGHWPTKGLILYDIGPVGSEVAMNSDLVESDPQYFWQDEYGTFLDYNVRIPRIVGESALSIVHSTPGLMEDGLGLARWFIPGIDAHDWSQFNFYWKFGVRISRIRVAFYSNFPGDYYWYSFGPMWSDIGWAVDRWGGDPYVNTEVTVVPLGDKAFDENGQPLYTKVGSPTWSRIRLVGIRFYYMTANSYANGVLDGAYFSGFRWKGTYADPPSIEDYGSCVGVFEGQYNSSEVCRAVAASIVEERKEPTITLEDLNILPRVDLRPCDNVLIAYSDIDTSAVINTIKLSYEQAKLDVTVQIGPVSPDYANFLRMQRDVERQRKRLDKTWGQRIREFFGWQKSRYGPI